MSIDSPWEPEQLAELLLSQGIPSRIDSHPLGAGITVPQRGRTTQLGIYVRNEDFAAADEVALTLMQSRMPAPPGPMRSNAEPLDVCPACDTPLSDNAESCGSCGLVFVVGGDS